MQVSDQNGLAIRKEKVLRDQTQSCHPALAMTPILLVESALFGYFALSNEVFKLFIPEGYIVFQKYFIDYFWWC